MGFVIRPFLPAWGRFVYVILSKNSSYLIATRRLGWPHNARMKKKWYFLSRYGIFFKIIHFCYSFTYATLSEHYSYTIQRWFTAYKHDTANCRAETDF